MHAFPTRRKRRPNQLGFVLTLFVDDLSEHLVMNPAAQSGHWFDWTKVWTEAARVLATDGSLAAWVYIPARISYLRTQWTRI